MVEIEYQGDESGAAAIALAGKGVTFDSGGLDLKALESMYTMKSDMVARQRSLRPSTRRGDCLSRSTSVPCSLSSRTCQAGRPCVPET
jgi:hypothetical protein